MPILSLPEIQGLVKAIKSMPWYKPGSELEELTKIGKWTNQDIPPEALEGLKRTAGTGSPTGFLSALKAVAPLIGAGALTVAGWAVPAKKLGEEIGWRLEERKAGKRLRPAEPSLKEYAKYIPGALAKAPLNLAKETFGTLKGAATAPFNVLSRIKKRVRK